jgi:hypothetical protein
MGQPATFDRRMTCVLLFVPITINYSKRPVLPLLQPILDAKRRSASAQLGWISLLYSVSNAASPQFLQTLTDHGSEAALCIEWVAGALAALVLLASIVTPIGFFVSIILPTLYALAIEELGEQTTKAPGLLTMGLLGCAVLPVLQGWLPLSKPRRMQSDRPRPARNSPPRRPTKLLDLRVSENRCFLRLAAGQPFFWLGDTAWESFHRFNREQATHHPASRPGNMGAVSGETGRFMLLVYSVAPHGNRVCMALPLH